MFFNSTVSIPKNNSLASTTQIHIISWISLENLLQGFICIPCLLACRSLPVQRLNLSTIYLPKSSDWEIRYLISNTSKQELTSLPLQETTEIIWLNQQMLDRAKETTINSKNPPPNQEILHQPCPAPTSLSPQPGAGLATRPEKGTAVSMNAVSLAHYQRCGHSQPWSVSPDSIFHQT